MISTDITMGYEFYIEKLNNFNFLMSHRKLEMGNAALKSQTKHITFFKQKFSGLSPMNK